jgi:RNA polymerase sigma-70 factor (ECF subfamily)
MLISLIAIASPSERDKIEQIYIKYKRLMYYVAYSVLKDKEHAEDAVHESFLRIINHLEKFQDISCNKTKGLIVIITKNISIDILRKKKKITEIHLQEVAHTLESDEVPPADFVTAAEGYAILVRSISQLDEKYADVLQLKYLYDYHDNEIAEIINISSDNVRVRLHRAKKKLQEIIGEEKLQNG